MGVRSCRGWGFGAVGGGGSELWLLKVQKKTEFRVILALKLVTYEFHQFFIFRIITTIILNPNILADKIL